MPLKTLSGRHADPRKGRGAGINPEGRRTSTARRSTTVGRNRQWSHRSDACHGGARASIITPILPDIPFTQSINPTRDASTVASTATPALRTLTATFAGHRLRDALRQGERRREAARSWLPGYRCEVISLGANIDPHQPIERGLKITRGILEVCAEFDQPVGIITKNALIERDLDILVPMAQKQLVNVFVSVNNLDHEIARRLEPRCSAPARRLEAMRRLSEAGIPVGVLVAPVIPFLTDHQIEPVLEAAWAHGARQTATH